MRTIEMKRFRILKIGFEENQNLLIKNFDKLESNVKANSHYINEKRNVIIELALARHASSYGLLGATFLPLKNNGEDKLSIEVRFNNDKNRFQESISNDSGYSYLGLGKDYAQSVLSSAMQFFSDKNVPAGKLIFDTAAHCEVGSSIVIFSIITKILLEILFNPNTQLSDGEIESICEKYII